MIEAEVDIKTRDGEMNTFVCIPEEGGPFPAVLFYMDAPGKREELHDMARRIASVGYFVVLPNLYYRKTREFTPVLDEAGMKQMFEMMSHLSNTLVVSDTEALLAFVDKSTARPPRSGRRGRLLHERPVRVRRRRSLPRAHRRHRVDLRRAPDQRRARFRAPHARRDQGRDLLRLRRDRPLGAEGADRRARAAS